MTALGQGTCRFPLFRATFLKNTKWLTDQASPDSKERKPPIATRGGLRPLDLGSLAPSEEVPDETQARQDKLKVFNVLCTEVAQGVYVGSEYIAKNRQILREHGITHVVNCVGQLYKDFFADELGYLTLYLLDATVEDIMCVVHEVLEFIEEALQQNGRVLLHCSQGVSRSIALAVAHVMWTDGLCYQTAFDKVKTKRGIANPNVGFVSQLMNWHKRRGQELAKPCLYSVVPHSGLAPHHLVLRPVQREQKALLDPRGAFLLHTPDALFLWKGSECIEDLVPAAQRQAAFLSKYEHAAAAQEVAEGKEPSEFWQALTQCKAECENPAITLLGTCSWLGAQYEKLGLSTARPPSTPPQTALDQPPATSRLRDDDGSASGRPGAEQAGFDASLQDSHRSTDSSVSTNSATSTSSSGSSDEASEDLTLPDSARQAKTPRDNSEPESSSPNARSRKMPRAFDQHLRDPLF